MVVSIHSLAQHIVQGYDRNFDGAINLDKTGAYEAERLQYQQHAAYEHDVLTLSWVSQADLFQQADTNADKKASLAEIKAALETFDINHDGYLQNYGPYWDSPGEYTHFNSRFPEQWGIISQQVIPRTYSPLPLRPLRALSSGSAGVWVSRN